LNQGHGIYIVSDLHVGAPNWEESLLREKQFVNWLNAVEADLGELILLGDIFDFWFEYKRSVPKGFLRILGKLAELGDKGIPIHLFTGNHDLWYGASLPRQIGLTLHTQPIIREWYGKKFYLAHGDGLGPGDHGYKFMKRLITHPLIKWLYGCMHPDWGIGLAHYVSGLSRKHQDSISPYSENTFLGEQEYLLIHSREQLKTRPDLNYFVYGHRHILREVSLGPHSTCVFLGDWIQYFSYLKIHEEEVQLQTYPLVPAHFATPDPVEFPRK